MTDTAILDENSGATIQNGYSELMSEKDRLTALEGVDVDIKSKKGSMALWIAIAAIVIILIIVAIIVLKVFIPW